MRLPIYQLDAFTSTLFHGNPAAVCPLKEWLPDEVMQAIAAENNLAETAFFVADGKVGYAIRWFTPTVEMDLCGHATLASAQVVLQFIQPDLHRVVFQTRQAGTLVVSRAGADGGELALDFPSRPAAPCDVPESLLRGLGARPEAVFGARDYLAVFPRAADIAALRPDFATLKTLDRFAVIVTAPGDEGGVDFVSRFFAPGSGVDEDPVTGSAHCTLIPYWAERLGKTRLKARQISQRGGELTCELSGDRVSIGGRCVLYLEGTISV
jgi:predicted PhzF superfamily epimerase YddE/YHI9